MKFLINLPLYLLIFYIVVCSSCQNKESFTEENPPEEGFNAAASDPRAIQIADSVMAAQGGRKNWDATRFISWHFFDARKLLWDKQTGNVRIENMKDDTKILVNIKTHKGRVLKNGTELTQPDSVTKYLQQGEEIWINDSFWLVMPFKLKDSGLTLKYVGEEKIASGKPAEVLELTYEKVGVTPENKYKVYVDKTTHLVSQWAYFKTAQDPEPAFVMPWLDYQSYGNIKLSGDRGQAKLTNIQVLEEVPETAFTSFEPVEAFK